MSSLFSHSNYNGEVLSNTIECINVIAYILIECNDQQ